MDLRNFTKKRKEKRVVKSKKKKQSIQDKGQDEKGESGLTITTVVDSPIEEQKPVKKKRYFF